MSRSKKKFGTQCDQCSLITNPIIYLRTSRKVCLPCWQAEKQTNQDLVNSLPDVVDKDAPLGYNFIINDYFTDEEKGKQYTDWAFNSMKSAIS